MRDPESEACEPEASHHHCELCEAAPITKRFHTDEVCWIAECESCDCPLVVWSGHGADPPADALDHMLVRLTEVADTELGPDQWVLDRVMRQIPDHFHAHARPKRRWLWS